MKDFDPAAAFGADVASTYDEQPRGDEESAVDFLAALGGEGPVLELAIGTGRIAVPLAARGVAVEGIELSPDMVDQLRTRPGGEALEVTIGDMSRVETGRTYPLVYLVFNTIFNLLTADDQVRCFENAARHLATDGVFVVETAVPSAWVTPERSRHVDAERIGVDSVVLDVARYDPVTQLLEESHVHLSPAGIKLSPIVCRLITPGEMDLMARLAGLRLVDRFGSWHREPFTANSAGHVSVYGRA